jgi:ABC-type uncharacterized transport system permease subunit
MDINFITAALYALTAGLAWREARASVGAPVAGAVARASNATRLLFVAIAMHAVGIWWAVFGADGTAVNLGFSHAVSLIAFLTILSYVALGRDVRLTRLAAIYLAPSAAAACVLVALLPGQRVVEYGALDGFFAAHVVVALLAYALFTVATLHALLTMFLQKQLQVGVVDEASADMPPLLKIERLMFQLLAAAFVLLTITLLTGVLFSEALFNKPFQITHKTVFAVMSWFVFGGLMAGHWIAGWRGKLAVRWVLIGFGMLLLSYVGSKFVLEVILQRV